MASDSTHHDAPVSLDSLEYVLGSYEQSFHYLLAHTSGIDGSDLQRMLDAHHVHMQAVAAAIYPVRNPITPKIAAGLNAMNRTPSKNTPSTSINIPKKPGSSAKATPFGSGGGRRGNVGGAGTLFSSPMTKGASGQVNKKTSAVQYIFSDSDEEEAHEDMGSENEVGITGLGKGSKLGKRQFRKVTISDGEFIDSDVEDTPTKKQKLGN